MKIRIKFNIPMYRYPQPGAPRWSVTYWGITFARNWFIGFARINEPEERTNV